LSIEEQQPSTHVARRRVRSRHRGTVRNDPCPRARRKSVSRRFRAPSPAFVLALVAVVLSATGLAVAAIPHSKGVIHSCYSKSDGSLRLVKASKCQKGEKKLKWNQQGRPGTRGSRGLRGAQGPPGPTFGAAGEGISGQVTDP